MSRQSLGSGRRNPVLALVAALLAAAVIAATAASAGATPLTEFSLPAGTTAGHLIDGPDDALWFGETTAAGTPELGRITTAGVITSTPVAPAGDVGDLALGAGGAIWFTLVDSAHAIGERTASGQINLITPGMDGLNVGASPGELTEGANGTVWFLDHGTTDAIGEITPGGAILEYPTGGNDPDDLAVAPNGDLWFTVFEMPGAVGFATPGTTAGTPATVFPTGSGTMPAGITADDDGNLWFSDQGTSAIGEVTTSGQMTTITEHGSLDGLQANADPDALAVGPDGNVWFDDQYGTNPEVGKITPAGQITEYPIAHEAWDLTAGIDGNMWFPTGDNGNTNPGVARVTTGGKIDIFSAGLNSGAVVGDGTNIVSGPDGNLWFNDIGSPNAIVRADVQLPPAVTTGAAKNVTASSAQLEGTANARGSASTITVQYGTTPSLGSTGAAGSEPAGDTSGAVSGTVTGLPAGTLIYYRLVASNAYGTVFGNTVSFTTVAKPSPPVVVAPATRTLHATVGNQQITVTVPASTPCLAAGARLPLKLSSAAIPGSKAAKLSFKRAALLIDRGIKRTRTKLVTVRHHKHHRRVTVYVANGTVRHLSATVSLSLHGQHSGPHTLRITLTYTRMRHVKHRTVRTTVTKTIKTRFTVC
jgi:virginiamycin B lyase